MAYLTKAQAQKQAERLAYHIRKYGVKVVIDLRTGAGGGHWGVDTFWGAMAHHIVSKRSQGKTPFYSLVRNGRSDVPGPLCNIYGGFDMVARIVTMGLANHSGKGGPWTISGHRIPQDNGRYYFLGTEFEGGMNESDWTPEYRRFMGAVNAGKLDYIRELRGKNVTIKDTALCEHSDWARPKGRKIDRLGYNQAKGIAEMQAARRGITPAPSTPAASDTLMDWINKMFDSKKEFERFVIDAVLEGNRQSHALQNEQLNLAWLRDMGRVSDQTSSTIAKVVNAVGTNLSGAIEALENGEDFDVDKFTDASKQAVKEALAEGARVTGELRVESTPPPAQPTT